MAKPTTAARKPTATKKIDAEPTEQEVRGELRQLADIRAKFPPLAADVAAQLLAQHDDASCRVRGTETLAAATFRGAMEWARTLGAHAHDPAVSPRRARWFFDCLTALGTLLSGRVTPANPSAASLIADAEHVADALVARTERRVRQAAGTNPAWTAALDAALVPDPDLDPRVAKLKQLSALLRAWLPKGVITKLFTSSSKEPNPPAPPLAVFDLDAETVDALDAALKALDEAIAQRPATQQPGRDSPAVNAAEGRLHFIMRVLWDDLAEARAEGRSGLQFTVTPTLLRALNLNARHKKKAAPTDGAKGPTEKA